MLNIAGSFEKTKVSHNWQQYNTFFKKTLKIYYKCQTLLINTH